MEDKKQNIKDNEYKRIMDSLMEISKVKKKKNLIQNIVLKKKLFMFILKKILMK